MRATHSPIRPRQPRQSIVARLATGLSSLAVLVLALVGLPLLLAWATPVIWAAGHDDLAHLLDRQDTGGVVLLLLAAVGWIGWAQFIYCTFRELVAQLRGLTWQPPRGLGASQRMAAALVGGILVLLPATSALASPAQASPTVASTHVPGQASRTNADGADQTAAAEKAQSAGSPRHTVRAGESLWSIAAKELGDGERWREIAARNEGHTMTDGQVFRSTSFLQPGWQLAMPTHPTASLEESQGTRGQLVSQSPDGPKHHRVTVAPGDSLFGLAEEELGEADRWPQLFDASRGKPQPGHLPAITNPNVIYPGQQVTVPGAPAGRSGRQTPASDDQNATEPHSPRATHTPSSKPEHDDRTHTPEHNAGSAAATPAPSPSATGAGEAASSAPAPTSHAPAGNASSAPAPQQPAEHAAPAILQMRTVLGAGALLAAAVTTALAMRRVLQRRRRQPGETITMAPQTSPAEAQLAAAAAPEGAARLDRALRTLAHHASEHDIALPVLRGARIGARRLQVLPDDLADKPLTPFTAGQSGWWQLPGDADLLDEDQARTIAAPYPALVTLGSTGGQDLLLADLTQLPAHVLLLDGNPVHITEVCTSLALELGMSPWAGDVEIVTIGFGEDLPQLLPTSRISHMREPAHALRDLTERLIEAHQMPETAHQPSLLLCAATLDADMAWEFAEVIDKAGRVPVALIAPANSAAGHFPEAEILNVSADTTQRLDHLTADISVQRLEHAAYQQVTAALALSGQPAQQPEGVWQDVPAETDPTPIAEPTPAGDAHSTPVDTATERAQPTEPAAEAGDDAVGGGIFPAVLAASSGPSSLPLLPAALPHHQPTDSDPSPCATQRFDDQPARSEDERADHAPASQTHSGQLEAVDPGAPEIRVLGPVEVDRVGTTGHGPRMAQLAALMYFRPGRTGDVLCSDMDPVNPWSAATLNARVQGLRRALGNDPDGSPYVPRRRSGDDPYQLAPTVACDWVRFLHLVERALPHKEGGLPDLEEALTLIRGRPFGTRPLPWAEPYQQEMATRIVDIAHTVATYRMAPGPHQDLSAARWAIAAGLDVDDTAEILYRDGMKIEAAAGNRSGLLVVISRIQQVNRTLDCDLELETEQLISDLLEGAGPRARSSL